MIIGRKSKREVIFSFINAKNFLIGLMVATFMVFASGTNITMSGDELFTILTGAGLFTVAAGLLIWARDISKKLYA